MKNFLPRLISQEQSSFVSGRDISDNVLLTQDLVQFLDGDPNMPNVIFKLDMMKAFDRVRWSFLERLLLKFGFGARVVSLIMGNLRSNWISFLFNGSPAGFFKPSRGIKQGDPLSPFLFILMSESFSRRINFLMTTGVIMHYTLPGGSLPISHLSFADDMIVFTKINRTSLHNLMSFFGDYEMVSGQRLSRAKSNFFTSDPLSSELNDLTVDLTGIPRGSFPFRYLGGQIYKGRKKAVYFQHILDSINKKIGGWHTKFLSSAGKLVLIRHVLLSLPHHIWSSFTPTKGVVCKIERILANFFWGRWREDGRPIIWRSWSRVTAPTVENGLGVRGIGDTIKAFSYKLWWRFKQGTTLWSNFLQSLPHHLLEKTSWKRVHEAGLSAAKHTKLVIRSGDCLFWFDNWFGDGLLHTFVVGEIYIPHLTLSEFFRHKDTYMDLFHDMLPPHISAAIMARKQVFISADGDLRIWKPSHSGIFTLKSAFNSLRASTPSSAILRHVWHKFLPLKVSIFGWKFINRLLPLSDNMLRFGFNGPNICALCKNEGETLHHTFWFCPIARPVWEFFSQVCGLRLKTSLWDTMLFWWSNNPSSTARPVVISAAPLFISWVIWKARNAWIFEGKATTSSRLIMNVKESLLHMSLVFNIQADSSPCVADLGLRVCRRRRRRIFAIAWRPPNQNWIKLNVDGAYHSGIGGTGYILRDSSATFIEAGGTPTHVSSVLHAETMSLLFGLQRCVDLSLSIIEIETDSMTLVNILRLQQPPPWELLELFGSIFTLLHTFTFSVNHIYRECNSVADYLAASSLRLSSSYRLFNQCVCSRRLKGLLMMDSKSIPYVSIG